MSRASVFPNRVVQKCFLCGEDVPVGAGVALGAPDEAVIAFHGVCLHTLTSIVAPTVDVRQGQDGVWSTPEGIRAKREQRSYSGIVPPRKNTVVSDK